MASSPPISIIVPTVYPPPRAWAVAENMREQVAAIGGEVIVASGHEVVTPAPPPPCRVVHVPGADVFALRAEAVPECRGDVVVLLEDHIDVPDDYCAKVVAAFEGSDALAIVGAVENGAPKVLDRASFLVTWGPFLPPLPAVPHDRCPPPGAIAYRREALPSDVPPPGWLEYELPVALRERGLVEVAPDLGVTHVQYVGMRAFSLQYHAGRGYSGLEHEPLASMGRRERLRHAARIPKVLVDQTRAGLARSGAHETRTCMALVTTFAACNALGQAVGVLRGAGTSPARME